MSRKKVIVAAGRTAGGYYSIVIHPAPRWAATFRTLEVVNIIVVDKKKKMKKDYTMKKISKSKRSYLTCTWPLSDFLPS